MNILILYKLVYAPSILFIITSKYSNFHTAIVNLCHLTRFFNFAIGFRKSMLIWF